MLSLLIHLLFVLFLFSSPLMASYPPEITGNIEWGEKNFQFGFEEEYDPLDDIEEDTYWYWKYFLRFQQRLKPYSYYYFRYEYQDRQYSLRDIYTSEVHQVTGNLTYQLNNFWRYYLQLNYRIRDYPFSLSSYQALTPSIQLNYYPTDRTTLTSRYQVQRRIYPYRQSSDYQLHGLIFSFNQRVNPSFTLNGRFRVDYKEPKDQEVLGNLEKRLSLGFRYVIQ